MFPGRLQKLNFVLCWVRLALSRHYVGRSGRNLMVQACKKTGVSVVGGAKRLAALGASDRLGFAVVAWRPSTHHTAVARPVATATALWKL